MLKRISLLTIGLCLLVLNTGCGSVFRNNAIVEPPGAYQIQSAATTDTSQNLGFNSANFNCRGLFKITPQSYVFSNGADTYEICRSTTATNTSDIEVHAETTVNSNSICVFPAEESSNSTITFVPSTDGSPLSECQKPSTDSSGNTGTYFSFPASSGNTAGFNAAYIIENDPQGKNVKLMKYCLSINFTDNFNCSNQNLSYSYGMF